MQDFIYEAIVNQPVKRETPMTHAQQYAKPEPSARAQMASRLLTIALIWFMVSPLPARAAELLLIEQPGCPWCAKVHRDILPAWPHTDEGRRVPIRRIDIAGGWPAELAAIPRERLTPTFILIENGRELARLRGFPGDDFIWPLLSEMIATTLSPESGGDDSPSHQNQ